MVGGAQLRAAVRTVTVVIDNTFPLGPVQVIWYVWSLSIGGVISVPDKAFVPLHAPDAVQAVTFDADHVNVVVPPGATPGGDALRVSDDGEVPTEPPEPPPPPQPARTSTARSVFDR